MNHTGRGIHASRFIPRVRRASRAAFAATAALAASLTGCNAETAWSEFRRASFDEFQAGMGAFFDGVVTGLGAIYQMGDGQEDPAATTAGG